LCLTVAFACKVSIPDQVTKCLVPSPGETSIRKGKNSSSSYSECFRHLSGNTINIHNWEI